MGKVMYLVNHAEAEGSSPHDELTAAGVIQAEGLGKLLAEHPVNRIITSPLMRARQTAAAIGERLGIHIEEDSRLAERRMSSQPFDDWLLKVEDTFLDLNLSYEDGESSSDAMNRACEVIAELPEDTTAVIVTHSLLLVLLMRCYNDRIGFDDWQAVQHPDVYELRISGDTGTVSRLAVHT